MADDEPVWSGLRDSLNRPTGRGTLQLSKRARYEGHMAGGERSGRGVLVVDEGCSSDEEGHRDMPIYTSSLRVSWRDDAPCGPGVFTEPDGASVHGQWIKGMLHGPVIERHSDGGLRFAGAYRNGQREGFGVEVRADGGALVGAWVGGELHGSRCAFLYPCRRGGALVGEWRRGVMLRAVFAEVKASPNEEHAKATKSSAPRRFGRRRTPVLEAAVHPSLESFVRAATAEAETADLFSLDASAVGKGHPSIVASAVNMLCARLLPRPQPYHLRFSYVGSGDGEATAASDLAPDPFESNQVEVRTSKIPGGGNGLFARRELQASEVAGFLFGCFKAHATGGAEGTQLPRGVPADWAVLLGDEWLTPHRAEEAPFCSTHLSAGWRANHGGWRANCTVERFHHPMVGDAACVRVLPSVRIPAGEELLVAYDHLPDLPDAVLPGWYRDLLNQRDENGYYAHLRHSPPRTVLDISSVAEAQRRVRVVQHGPWRVLWVGAVEQGMTYHGASRSIDPPPLMELVVGFDYQRTMVSSASALVGCFGARASEARRRPHGLLIGLGGGSCAAALHKLGCDVTVLEYDQAVLDAARIAHGLSFEVRPSAQEARCKDSEHAVGVGGASHRRPIVVHLADAAEAIRQSSGSFDFALLDAYDGNGDVPSHLQASSFVTNVGCALTANGFVLANLWNGSDAAKRAREHFSKNLQASVGKVFALQVEGHEQNIILLSVKGQESSATGPSLEAVRALLQAAAAPGVDGCVEEALLARCMRSCAATISSLSDPWAGGTNNSVAV